MIVDGNLAEQPERAVRAGQGADEPGGLAPYLERVSCPVCHGRAFDILRKATYEAGLTTQELLKVYCSSSEQTLMDQLVVCRGCGLVYLNPRVKGSVIMEAYSSAVDPRFAEQNPQRIATFRRVLRKWIRRFPMVPNPEKKVLDVGCAAGAFPKVASDLGFTTVGVEPSRWLCDLGRTKYGLDLRSGTLESQQFPEEEFDLITLWDVLEHLLDPGETLCQVHDLLKRDGYLIVNYPDYSSLPRKLLGYRWPFFLSVHLFYFTPETMRRFLEGLGFEVLEMRPYFQTLRLGYVLERATGYFALFGALKRFTDALHLSELPLTYYIGQSMVTVRKT